MVLYVSLSKIWNAGARAEAEAEAGARATTQMLKTAKMVF